MFFVTGLIILITLVNIIVYYLRQRHEEEQTQALSSSGLQCRRFSLAEIKWATQNFDAGLVIGKGGFGEVYKGIIDNGATTVAIKRLGFWSSQGAPEFWTEIEMLSKFRHSHLVSLIGYCNDHPEMIIVYEYMTGGTLADNLHRMRSHRPLSWIQRLKACLGAARGLDYLHTGTDIQTRVIHRDVKSTNILLDANCDAKISDFGLSKIGPAEQNYTHVSTRVKGTFGYMDPEYIWTHRLTRKSDVYAFGVVMLEALCGRPAVDRNLGEEQWGLVKWAKHCIKEGRVLEIVDPHLNGSFLSDCLEAFAQIAEQCLHGSSRKRPTMAEVVTRLEYALSLQEGTSLSLVDAGIITRGGNYDRQEGAGSPLEPDDNHAANLIQNQIQVTKKMTYVQKAWRFFSTKDTVISGRKNRSGAAIYSQLIKAKEMAFLEKDDGVTGLELIRRGGCGEVYRTELQGSKVKTIAIKKITIATKDAGELTEKDTNLLDKKMRQIKSEIQTVGQIRHRNLLPLLAHVSRPDCHYLVYEFMKNGSLQDMITQVSEGNRELDWLARHRIAIGVACGLEYLHMSQYPRIIHRDLKPANVLLDDDMEARIAGFGLAKAVPDADTHVTSSNVAGTLGYIAPEYHQTMKFTDKCDIYSFGVLLGVLVTGKVPSDEFFQHISRISLVNWMRNVMTSEEPKRAIDSKLMGNGYEEQMLLVLKIACFCTLDNPKERPDSKDVRCMLDQIKH